MEVELVNKWRAWRNWVMVGGGIESGEEDGVERNWIVGRRALELKQPNFLTEYGSGNRRRG